MRKLKLNVDELQVESFQASYDPGAGTVNAHASAGTGCYDCTPAGTYDLYTCETSCKQEFCTCPTGEPTCEYTAAQSCVMDENTCYDGCAFTQDPYTCQTGIHYPGCR